MRRTGWLVGAILGGLVAAVALALFAVAGSDARREWVWPALLAPRNALTAAAAALLVIAAGLSALRRTRPVSLPVAIGFAVAVAFSLPAIIQRGVPQQAQAIDAQSELRVFEWNTNGGLVVPDGVVSAALAQRPDIIVLPDGDYYRTKGAYLAAFASHGADFTAFTTPGSDPHLVVFIEAQYASHYRSAGTGPIADRSLLVQSDTPALPTIAAVHAPIPTPAGSPGWRASVAWAEQRCGDGDSIVVGDFNATADAIGTRLGDCEDAASEVGASDVGTWPTALPEWLAMPIDHVYATSDWGAASFTVIPHHGSGVDGARHRATLTVIGLRATR